MVATLLAAAFAAMRLAYGGRAKRA
jgi:hypothetical protein